MTRPSIALLAALLALLCGAAGAAAASPRLFVDAESRGGRCSDAVPPSANGLRRPWCSLARGLEAAPGGSTILLRGGSHPPVLVADAVKHRYVTIAPFRRERPSVRGIELVRARHLRFRRLRFTDGILVRFSRDIEVLRSEIALTPGGPGPATNSGVILQSVDRVRVQRNHVHDGRDGVNIISARPPSRRVTVAGNRFQRMGNDGVHVKAASDVTIVGNRFEDVMKRPDVDPGAHADGIQMVGPTRGVVVWGNRFTGGRGLLAMADPEDVADAGQGHTGLVVANNAFLGRDFGIRTFSTPGARIVNNTVWGTSSSPHSGVDLRDRVGRANDRSPALVLANNVVRTLDVDPAVGFAAWEGNLIRTGPRRARDLAGAPDLVASLAGDLRLAPGSAGIDAAVREHAPPIDIDGRRRSPRPDAGAYERGGRASGIGRIVRRLRILLRR